MCEHAHVGAGSRDWIGRPASTIVNDVKITFLFVRIDAGVERGIVGEQYEYIATGHPIGRHRRHLLFCTTPTPLEN